MASTSTAMITALDTALKRANGADGYTYDLSATDALKFGVYFEPPDKTATVFVAVWERELKRGGFDVPLNRYPRTAQWRAVGWVKSTADLQVAMGAAMTLRDDIMVALERGVYGKAGDTPVGGDLATVNSQPIVLGELVGGYHFDEKVQLPTWGRCSVDFELSWRQRYGA